MLTYGQNETKTCRVGEVTTTTEQKQESGINYTGELEKQKPLRLNACC